jgi:FtsZ-interacting cell division protein YlmF
MTRKHSTSKRYGDPNSVYFALGPQERERRKQAARENAARIRELDPKAPKRPWSREEMADVFESHDDLIDIAIRQNRSYEDVRTMSMELTRQYNKDPIVLMTFIDLSEAQMKYRLAADRGEHFVVCPECFTYPHQISCSHAE